MSHRPAAKQAKSARPETLSGTIRMPGTATICELAVVLAGLASGKTRMTGLLQSEAVVKLADAMQVMGARIARDGEEWIIRGTGNGALLAPPAGFADAPHQAVDHLLMGLVSSYDFDSAFDGDALLAAPAVAATNRVLAPLREMGVQVTSAGGGPGLLILHGPATSSPISYRLPEPGAGLKSAVLLAGLNVPGVTTVIDPFLSEDHAERMLLAFGADLDMEAGASGERVTRLQGRGRLTGRQVDIPGNASLAVFPLVAALLMPGSDLIIENVELGSMLTALILTLQEMGGDIAVKDRRGSDLLGDEAEVADLHVRSSRLQGICVPSDRMLALGADYPVLAVAAALAEGETVLEGIGAVRQAAADHFVALVAELVRNRVDLEESGDRLRLRGRPGGAGYSACSGNRTTDRADYRVALSLLVFDQVVEGALAGDDPSLGPDLFRVIGVTSRGEA